MMGEYEAKKIRFNEKKKKKNHITPHRHKTFLFRMVEMSLMQCM
jgi:hypothetical protein